MANVKLAFLGTKNSGTNDVELIISNDEFNIVISLEDTSSNHDYNYQEIVIDKSTAIKLHRELKKQISFLQEGGQNG